MQHQKVHNTQRSYIRKKKTYASKQYTICFRNTGLNVERTGRVVQHQKVYSAQRSSKNKKKGIFSKENDCFATTDHLEHELGYGTYLEVKIRPQPFQDAHSCPDKVLDP